MRMLTEHFAYEEAAMNPNEKARAVGFMREDYPENMVISCLIPLYVQLEVLRAELGGQPMFIDSLWRTVAYNDWIYTSEGKTPTQSQHCLGRAADVVVHAVDAQVVRDTAFRMFGEGRLKIGGLGRYATFTHVDIRPVGSEGHLAQWDGGRAGN